MLGQHGAFVLSFDCLTAAVNRVFPSSDASVIIGVVNNLYKIY